MTIEVIRPNPFDSRAHMRIDLLDCLGVIGVGLARALASALATDVPDRQAHELHPDAGGHPPPAYPRTARRS